MYRHNSRHGSVRHGAPALLLVAALAIGRITAPGVAQDAALNTPPAGFTALFNGRDLAGWKGLVADPPKRAQMSAQELAAAQEQADARMREHWRVADGVLVFDGKGDSLCTARDYGDFELRVDWKIEAGGDSGIYLRGSPQVQIWEKPAVGSGGLYNNQKHPSQPLFVADRPPGEWNTFRILMSGERVTVYLNGVLVVDDTPLENYWERGKPICPTGQIELQNHGGPLWFRDIFIRELPASRAAQPAAATLPGGAVESVAAGLLQHGDRVAIVGDSITEQKWYSRFMEDYLVACLPELELRVAQFGWSGERAPGFAARMANDLLPWRPTVVTTCYGMNDGLYRPYELGIGTTYADGMRQIVAPLLERKGGEAGAAARPVRVVVGAPGAVDTFSFRRPDRVAPEAYNDNLAHLRDIARELAREFGQPFANVHDHMVLAMLRAKPALGQEYHVCGGDGFHPAPNGHLVMAYAFLKALGCDGQIGTITLEWGKPATASTGHKVLPPAERQEKQDSGAARIELESTRWPFCFYDYGKAREESTRSILPFVPFNADLNRFVLVIKGLPSPAAKVTWGVAEHAKTFTREQLEAGVNLAAEFLDNPFCEPFRKLDEAVGRKQAFETQMVKEGIADFRWMRERLGDDAEAAAAMDTLRERLFAKQAALQAEVRGLVMPVRHTILIEPSEQAR